MEAIVKKNLDVDKNGYTRCPECWIAVLPSEIDDLDGECEACHRFGDYCVGCLFNEDGDFCHYLCQECRLGNNRTRHEGFCKHGTSKSVDCVECLKEKNKKLQKRINKMLKRKAGRKSRRSISK